MNIWGRGECSELVDVESESRAEKTAGRGSIYTLRVGIVLVSPSFASIRADRR